MALAVGLLAILMVGMLSGCGSDPLVGTWSSYTDSYEFNRNGSGVFSSAGERHGFTWSTNDGILTIDFDRWAAEMFEYSIVNVTLTLTQIDAAGRTFGTRRFTRQ